MTKPHRLRTAVLAGAAVLLAGLFLWGWPVAAGSGSLDLPGQPGNPSAIIKETKGKLLWELPDEQQVWLTKSPKRVVVLLTSLLNLWYEAEGQAIARCSGKLHVPQGALGLPEVGAFNNPNIEKIIALEPDLVISSNLPAFRAILPILKENQIEYVYFIILIAMIISVF